MSTPEGKIKDDVKKLLKHHGAYYHMPVQNGMGKPTLDFVGCHQRMFYAVEAKAPGKVPTPRQEVTIREIVSAGGKVFVVDGGPGTDGYETLRNWLLHGARGTI